MPTKIQGGLGIDKVQDGTVGLSDVDTELYGKITALTTINLGEAKTASGTFVDFDVPLGVKRITVMFDGVSTNGASNIIAQLGSGTIQTTGYASAIAGLAALTPFSVSSSSGFIISGGGATSISYSVSRIEKVGVNDDWLCTHVARSTANTVEFGNGRAVLSGTLDRLRITTVNGTDQFDAGTINISWEF